MEKIPSLPRNVYTSKPLIGDYILSFTGHRWNVLRHTGNGAAMSVSTGDRVRNIALERIRSLSELDGADGWEADSESLFRQVVQFRR